MSINQDDPHCPECGEPIGQTATYCMHCSADLTEEREQADADDDGVWDGAESGSAATTPSPEEATASTASATSSTTGGSDQLLDPDGLVDNTLTVIVGIGGGIVVGLVGTIVLGAVTGSAISLLFGLFVWLGSTAYLVRRRTVQGAVAKSGYAVALVLLLVPVISVSPFVNVDGGLEERASLFFVLLLSVAIPAGIAAAVGWVASRFVPEGTTR